MTTFDIVLILAGACGVIMVLGGIVLLYTGAIKLADTPREQALAIEFKKYLKVTTQYPALGIFVIGLAFVGAALWTSKPGEVSPLAVRGKVTEPDGPLTAVVRSAEWRVETLPSNVLHGTIYPDTRQLYLEVIAPGYRDLFPLDAEKIDRGVADLGEVALTPIVPEIPTDSTNIEAIAFASPTLSAQGKYGVGGIR